MDTLQRASVPPANLGSYSPKPAPAIQPAMASGQVNVSALRSPMPNAQPVTSPFYPSVVRRQTLPASLSKVASTSSASAQSQAKQAATQVYNVLNSQIESLKHQQTTIVNNYPTPSVLPLPPALGNWTQVNYGGSISDNENGYIYLQAPASSTYSLRMLTLPINSPTYTLSASFRQLFPVAWTTTSSLSYACGLVLRNSSSGKVIFVYVSFFGGIQFGINQYSDPTTYSGTPFYTGWPTWVNNTCIRIQETSTTRTYSWSNDDGLHWMPAYSEPAGTFIAPDQVGICADSENVASAVGITLNGWQLTTP